MVVQEVRPRRLTKGTCNKECHIIRDPKVSFQQKVSKVLSHLIAAWTAKSGSTRKITQILSSMTFHFYVVLRLGLLRQTITVVHLNLIWTDVHRKINAFNHSEAANCRYPWDWSEAIALSVGYLLCVRPQCYDGQWGTYSLCSQGRQTWGQVVSAQCRVTDNLPWSLEKENRIQSGEVKEMPKTAFPKSCFLSTLVDDTYCVPQWIYLL